MNELKTFPRKLSEDEKFLLLKILPASKPGYNIYRNKIKEKLLIGESRFGNGNLLLGSKDDAIDLNIPATPVLASGSVKVNDIKYDLTIHEEEEHQVEIDIAPYPVEKGISEKDAEVFTYSYWKLGDKSPGTNDDPRVIELKKDEYYLAISSGLKRMWLFESVTGVNHLLPLTNFFNELMRLKNERDPKVALKPGSLFNVIDQSGDDEIKKAFLMYNKYMRKLDVDLKPDDVLKKKKRKFSFFKRSKN